MRKKEIEKIPYMGLPELKADGKAQYVGVTALREVGGKAHIILEVYRNMEGCTERPIVRYVASNDGWGVYEVALGKWRGKGIQPGGWGRQMCWEDERACYGSWEREENVLHSEEDLRRIKEFFKGGAEWENKQWWEYFKGNEYMVRMLESDRKKKRREKLLRERMENTPELDEAAMTGWADGELFGGKHYLYYKKRGRRAEVCCSACGKVDVGVWKESPYLPFGGMPERRIREPENHRTGKCALCGASGEYRMQGRAKRGYSQAKGAFLVDRYKEEGAVVRCVTLEKEWILDLEEAGKESGMTGARERVRCEEYARTYFEPGENPKTDFAKINGCSLEGFWDDRNVYGGSVVRIVKGKVHPASWEALKGTFLRYSAMEEYGKEFGEFNASDYLRTYNAFPQLEMVVKLGLYGVAEHMVERGYGIIAKAGAKTPDAFLGIRKEGVRMLAGERGDVEVLKVLQAEKRLGERWSLQQVAELKEVGMNAGDLGDLLRVTTVQKLLNAISAYAGCEYGTGCYGATERLQETAICYLDYLKMREELGYDMGNAAYIRPRDLKAAHDAMMEERNAKRQELRMLEVDKKFPGIRKNYRKLRKRYFYEKDGFFIRPAMSASEIVLEGRALHHCVGGDGYMKNHADGKSLILFLRKNGERDKPFVTVEMDPEGEVRQWSGENNRKPDREKVEKWLEGYAAWLKGGREDADVRLLVAAG